MTGHPSKSQNFNKYCGFKRETHKKTKTPNTFKQAHLDAEF